ncbi:MAG: hypothetical protein ABIG70_12850 [Pseudomonadota bacterium]
MNPLLIEYNKRRRSHHAPAARGAYELLLACIHEAGHWIAFAHNKIPVVRAIVDRRSHYGYGCVTPTALFGFVPDGMEAQVEYFVTVAGPGALCALIPFVDMGNIRGTSLGDRCDARRLLDHMFGSNHKTRVKFREQKVSEVEQLIRQNWPVIEALAYELIRCGRLNVTQCQNIEKRYGIGRHNLTVPRLESAWKRLSSFHSSPDGLLKSLLAID